MTLRLVQANLKARDDGALGRFWAAALGWRTSSSGAGATAVAPAGFVWTDPDAPVCVDVIAVPDPATVRCRAHLELATASATHRTELVARLRDLGATSVRDGRGDGPGTLLADPEGNEFRVLDPGDDDPDTGPIAAVVVDCADPPALARFWGAAVDWPSHGVTEDRARLRSARGVGPFLDFRRVPAGTTARHRFHLDVVPVRGDGQAAEVARLRAWGASPVDVGRGDFPWVVLADPEGNEFCVLRPADR